MDYIFKIESPDVFQNVSEEIISNLYYTESLSSQTLLDVHITEKAKQDLISIFNDSNFDMQQITNMMYNKGWQQDKVKSFVNLIEQNKSRVLSAALNHYNSSYCDTLVNFDWFVKFVLGTSELKNLKYPLLQLVICTLNKNGKQDKIIYEAKKDMLLKMITVLESIK